MCNLWDLLKVLFEMWWVSGVLPCRQPIILYLNLHGAAVKFWVGLHLGFLQTNLYAAGSVLTRRGATGKIGQVTHSALTNIKSASYASGSMKYAMIKYREGGSVGICLEYDTFRNFPFRANLLDRNGFFAFLFESEHFTHVKIKNSNNF